MAERTSSDNAVSVAELAELNEKKAAIFESMAVINRSFEQVIGAIYRLETMNVVTLDYAVEQEIITNELWAGINCHLLASVNRHELDDRSHYSRVRANLTREAERARAGVSAKKRPNRKRRFR